MEASIKSLNDGFRVATLRAANDGLRLPLCCHLFQSPFALFFLGRCLPCGSCRRVPLAISGVTDGECPAARMRENRTELDGKLTPVCGAFKCWNTFIYPPATWYDPIWIASPSPTAAGLLLILFAEIIFPFPISGGCEPKLGGVVPAIFIIFSFFVLFFIRQIGQISWKLEAGRVAPDWPAGGMPAYVLVRWECRKFVYTLETFLFVSVLIWSAWLCKGLVGFEAIDG